MTTLIKFPHIDQFRNVIKHVRDNAKYHNVPVPTVRFEGTVKLHGCVHKDTLITLADGSREKISDITPGTSILSYNETTSQVEFDVVNEVIIQELDKKWIQLTFDNGTVLKCTSDHPILTTEGWVVASKLSDTHVLIDET